MKLIYILLVLAVVMVVMPCIAFATTSADVTITATGNVSGYCPSDFSIAIITPYEIKLSWVNATGNNTVGTTVRAAYGREVGNATDGFEVYSGNATGVTHWVNTEFISVDVYYGLYTVYENGSYGNCSAQGLVAGGEGLEEIGSGLTGLALGLENIGELLTLLTYFILPLGLAIAYMRWHSYVLGVPAIIASVMALPFLQENGWLYTVPVLILAIGMGMRLVRDGWNGDAHI